MSFGNKLVHEHFKTQRICDKAVDICSFVFHCIPDWYKGQKMCDKVFSEDPFMIKYCLNRCKTQMCDKVINEFLLSSKFVPDWFPINKMIKKCYNALFADATVSSNEMGILRVDLNNVNLSDSNFSEDDLKTIIHVGSMAWHNKLK